MRDYGIFLLKCVSSLCIAPVFPCSVLEMAIFPAILSYSHFFIMDIPLASDATVDWSFSVWPSSNAQTCTTCSYRLPPAQMPCNAAAPSPHLTPDCSAMHAAPPRLVSTTLSHFLLFKNFQTLFTSTSLPLTPFI